MGLAQRLLGHLTRRRRPLRLLVLEDDETLGPRKGTGLSEAGHVVNLAPNGKDAVIAAIAELCGAMLSQADAPGDQGLMVRVHFPALAKAQTSRKVVAKSQRHC